MKIHFKFLAASTVLLMLLAASIPAAADDTVNSSSSAASSASPVKHNKANYELAARWTAQKTGKLVFDTSVTPHWMDTGDRFWYAYENNSGRRFYIVDPVKKTKSLVFDPPKLAALLTTATGLPHEGQHLDFRLEAFNALNHPQFAAPGASQGSGNFGVITSTHTDNRDLQLALKYVF